MLHRKQLYFSKITFTNKSEENKTRLAQNKLETTSDSPTFHDLTDSKRLVKTAIHIDTVESG